MCSQMNTQTFRILPGLRVEISELVQDVDLHWSDLAKLICSMSKLLCNAMKRRANEIMEIVKSNRKLTV